MAKNMGETRDLLQGMIGDASQKVLEPFLKDPVVKHSFVRVLLDQGMTYKQIQEIAHISPNEISKIKMGDDESVNEALVDTIRNMEINKLYLIGSKLLQALDDPDKIKSMKGAELSYAYKILLESRRLLENKTTSNIGVIVQTLNRRFDEESEKINDALSRISKKTPKVIETCSPSASQ